MGLVLGRKPERETLCFLCKVAFTSDEGQLVCEAGAGWVRPQLGVSAASMCFACSCTLQLYMVFWNLWL